MENASHALMIAGAVLLTLMVLAIVMYFFTELTGFPAKQEEAILQEQITKFNQEYESYYKDKMYGTDVVTILNKVINHNKKYADPVTGEYKIDADNHFINVEITLIKDVISYAEQYIEIPDSTSLNANKPLVDRVPITKGTIKGLVNGKKGNEKTFVLGTKLPAKIITLMDPDLHGKFIIKRNMTLEEFIQNDETYKIQLTEGGTKARTFDEFNYTIVYTGFTDFKRKFFECTGLKYNKETGRVEGISFRELETDED